MAVRTGSTTHALAPQTQWAGFARRATRLQHAQLVLLILVSAVAVLATMLFSRNLARLNADQARAQHTLEAIVDLRDRMRVEHVIFWRLRAGGDTRLAPTNRLLAATGPAGLRQIIASDPAQTPSERRLQQVLTRKVDEFSAFLLDSPSGLVAGSPEDRRFVRDADLKVRELQELANDWLRIKQSQVTASATNVASAGRRGAVILTSLLGGLALLAIAASTWLGRSRTRLMHRLERTANDLADLAVTDQLTGLAGHAAFHERLRHEVAAAHAENRHLALILVDLDHFKDINDTFGHPAGDEVLRATADLMRSMARPADVVARVGGEEFAWLLPDTTAHEGFAVAERLRTAMAARPIGPIRSITMSLGVCDLVPGRTAAELVRLADGALYWAKAHGRNITFRYSPDVVEELSVAERAARLERLAAINTVRALAKAVDAKDPTTQRHSERVGQLAQSLALELGWSERQAAELFEAGLVHDVGKIGVPDAILFKPSRLDPVEMQQIKMHPSLGAQMVTGVLSASQVRWIRGHHERMDGRGYPDGLVDLAIPEGARILALADAWDAMTNVRPYTDGALSVQDALEECRRSAGTQFWPPCVDALARIVADGRLPQQPAVAEVATTV